MNNSPVVELDNVSKVYYLRSGDVVALDRVSLSIEAGEFVAIMGPSGSGKSTLLNQVGSMDVPTSGDLYITGQNIGKMADFDLTKMRLNTIGYIFQKFNLIPLLTAFENVEYPYILKNRKRDASGKVCSILEMMGIDEDLSLHRPSELSGGQQQRVAIARALINEPKILLCDEPTGNLDSRTGRHIMEILTRLNGEGMTVIMVTHDPAIAGYARRTINLVDGRLACS